MQKDLSSVSGVVKLENPKIHNQHTAVCSGNIVCITQGGNGETPWEVRTFCDLCRALLRGLCWKMRKSTAAGQCGERPKGELCAGEWRSNPQPVTKTEKKLYGLFIWGKRVLSATGRSAVYGLLNSKEEANDPGQQKPGSLRIHKEGA